jgi:hypothetical protein
MTTPISLTLNKRTDSALDGLQMYEIVPLERIQALLKSNLLLLAWDEPWASHEWNKFANEKTQITAYMKQYNKNVGGILVKYNKCKHKWGRSYPFKSLGLTAIRREVRNALIKSLYYDCDLKNAQPEIIRNICESNNIPCPIIQRYCAERETILQQVQDRWKVDRNKAKDLFIRLCFSGTFYGWVKDNKIQDIPVSEFVVCFEREVSDIGERLRKKNPTLYECARKKKQDKGETSENRILGSFFALYNQEYESRIVEAVLCYLIHQTDLMKYAGLDTPVGTYEYDGIKLWKENVDNYEGGLAAVLELLNQKTLELTGFHLEWSAKSLDDGFCLDKWLEAIEEEAKPDNCLFVDCDIIEKACGNSDVGVAETINKLLPKHFIYSKEKSTGKAIGWFGWNGNRWEQSDSPLRRAIMYDVAVYLSNIMDKWTAKYLKMHFPEDVEPSSSYKLWKRTYDKMMRMILYLKSANGISNVVSVARDLMTDYTLEFDANENLFGCENGVIDIGEECFRPYRFDDYMTWSCGYDFRLLSGCIKVKTGDTFTEFQPSDETPEDVEMGKILIDVYKKIFPDEDLRDYFFKVVSTGLSGKAIEHFFVLNGAGRNGKGFHNEFMEVVLGDYYCSVSPVIFSEDQKKKRAERNAARNKLLKEGKVHKGDGKDVDHKTPLSKGGTTVRSNLRAVPASKNRSVKRNKDSSLK